MKIICGKCFAEEFKKALSNLSKDEMREILDKNVELEDNESKIVVVDNERVIDYIYNKGQD